jgi:hypothetical protein
MLEQLMLKNWQQAFGFGTIDLPVGLRIGRWTGVFVGGGNGGL